MNPNQAQYRNAPSQRSPHNVAPRRGGPQQQASAAATAQMQNAQQQQQAMMAQQMRERRDVEMARRRAHMPTDKNLPDGIESYIIGDGVTEYKRLREIERKLDMTMIRKKLDLEDPRTHAVPRTRTIRIWISNTADGQPWQGGSLDADAFDFKSGTDATYRLKITGKLLDSHNADVEGDEDADDEKTTSEKPTADDAMDEDTQGRSGSQKPPREQLRKRQKLSHFFSRISVEFDRNKHLQQDGAASIEWRRPENVEYLANLPPAANFDTLELERKSDENINCTINLYRDETPEQYALSPALADLLDMKEATRDAVMAALWEYAKQNKLQHDEEKRSIICDEAMHKVFGLEQVFFPALSDHITSHLLPLPPIQLPYTIRVDPEYQSSPTPTIYDVLVPDEDRVRDLLHGIRTDQKYPATLKSIAALDQQLALVVQALNESKARHTFFEGMSKDPVRVLQKWLKSQKRDMEIILGESRGGENFDWLGEEFRRGGTNGVWGSDEVRESVGLMVSKLGHK